MNIKMNIMDKLERILYESNVDQRDTIESYNKAVDEAVSEIENGESYTHEEVESMSKQNTN